MEGKIARHVHLRGEVAQQKAKSNGVRSDSQLTRPFILVKKACRKRSSTERSVICEYEKKHGTNNAADTNNFFSRFSP